MADEAAVTGVGTSVLTAPPPAPGETFRESAAEARTARLAAGVRGRLLAPMPANDRWAWWGPLLITLAAGLLRVWRLGTPSTIVFDETYYAEQARDLLRYGAEYNDKDGVAEFVVHPPVGKWVIAVGEQIFGYDSFGWRFSVAVVGTLSVLVIARTARRLFRSTLLGCIAGALLAFDGQHFVHSRTALLDLILMFFVLCAFSCLVVDRDRARERLASAVERDPSGALTRHGVALGLRPWRLAAGVFLGLALGTKWSGLFFIAAFGLMTVLWDLGARRTAGIPRPVRATLRRDVGPAFLSLVPTALVVYVVSWSGWFAAGPDRAYGRDWAEGQPDSWVPDSVRSLWRYHEQAYAFHKNLRTPHDYESNPWSWLILGRPVSFHYQGTAQGITGCGADSCSQAVTALGTAAVWWAAIGAIAVVLALWVGRRDWRAGAILAGFAAGYLPWFVYQERTIFSFYAIVFLPYLVLAITMVLGMVLGPARSSDRRRTIGAAVVACYLVLVIVNFMWNYPILSAETITYAAWYDRMWFASCI